TQRVEVASCSEPSGSTRYRYNSQYLAYAPSITKAPCARLTMLRIPQTSEKPSETVAYVPPINRPLTAFCSATSVLKIMGGRLRPRGSPHRGRPRPVRGGYRRALQAGAG